MKELRDRPSGRRKHLGECVGVSREFERSSEVDLQV